VSIALKHFQEEIPSVRKFDPRIPQALENVVLKATAKSPAQRYTSVEAMNEDLATALSPKRAHEARWAPHVDDDLGETRVMDALPNALRQVTATNPDETHEIPVKSVIDLPKKPDKNKKKKFSRKQKIWLTAGGLIAALLAILLIIIWPKGDVSVPDVSDMNAERARVQLENAKLEVGSEKTQHSNSVKKGYVIRTDPDHGTSVKSGSKVNLIVSSGVKKYTVQDYTGENYSDVADDLRSKGFKVRKSKRYSASGVAGTILDQSIAAGKKVNPKKTTIVLTVADNNSTDENSSSNSSSAKDSDDKSGDGNSSSFTLANLSQYNYQALLGYAQEHGINVKYSGDKTGLVASQSPSSGSNISEGDTVTVVFKATSQSTGESSNGTVVGNDNSVENGNATDETSSSSSNATTESSHSDTGGSSSSSSQPK
jgi:serine/threonine-protein kinase